MSQSTFHWNGRGHPDGKEECQKTAIIKNLFINPESKLKICMGLVNAVWSNLVSSLCFCYELKQKVNGLISVL